MGIIIYYSIVVIMSWKNRDAYVYVLILYARELILKYNIIYMYIHVENAL